MSDRGTASKLSTKRLGAAFVSTAAVGAGFAAAAPAADAFYCTAYGGPGTACHHYNTYWDANSGTSSGNQYVCVNASQSGEPVHGGSPGGGVYCAPTGYDISFPISYDGLWHYNPPGTQCVYGGTSVRGVCGVPHLLVMTWSPSIPRRTPQPRRIYSG